MNFMMDKGILFLNVNAIGTLTIGVLLLLLGQFLKKKINFLQRMCIPAPVVGGFVFAILNSVLWSFDILKIKLDTLYQSPFMVIFFITVGLSASIKLFKKGGRLLPIYFTLTAIMILIEAGVGVGMANLLNIPHILGVISGPASLAGGHGSVASYGQIIEDMGHSGVIVVGMAAATFGLISGSFFGGPICKRLIVKHNLKLEDDNFDDSGLQDITNDPNDPNDPNDSVDVQTFMKHLAIITVCMTIGGVITSIIKDMSNFILPAFVGPVIVAILLRNINDKFKVLNINMGLIEKISDVSLGIFLSIALMSLRLWELVGLAGPLSIILIVEIAILLLYVYFVAFRVLGSNFDAAVMCAGLIGHGTGATPNAMANMGSIAERYGKSKRAFIIVPLVGGFMQDWILIPTVLYLINTFR